MPISMNHFKGRHSEYSLHFHIVFVTKYRRKVLGKIHLRRLQEIFSELAICAECELAEFNGEPDHVHLLIYASPNTPSIAKLVNNFKAVSARRMRNEFTDLVGAYKTPVLWSRSYFAGTCGGAPLGVIRDYIRNQQG